MSDIKITIIDDGQSRRTPLCRQLVMITFVFTVLFVPGLLTGNEAMQWAGFCACGVLILADAMANESERLTISEAQEKLETLDAKAKAEAEAKAKAKAKAFDKLMQNRPLPKR